MTVNLSYSMINETVLEKRIFQFKSITDEDHKNIKKQKIGIAFETEITYDSNLEMLKIVIFQIILNRKNYSPSKY